MLKVQCSGRAELTPVAYIITPPVDIQEDSPQFYYCTTRPYHISASVYDMRFPAQDSLFKRLKSQNVDTTLSVYKPT